MGELTVSSINSAGLQDAQWEIDECVRSSASTAIELGLPARFCDLLRTEVGLLQAVAAHDKRSLASFTVLAKRA
jgi:hypothetical protein